MRALVTGAAGFIGSHLVGALLDRGDFVRAVDCFTEAYDIGQKRRNLRDVLNADELEFIESDLRYDDIHRLLEGIEVVFHHAAMPGVRPSWSLQFPEYVGHNILATHRLLEACRHADLDRLIYASSSSVYGNALSYPTHESDPTQPYSPYGVTKLAGEHLCLAYADNFGIPAILLRYFTVYGPRQRPDMAMHRLIEAALGRGTFQVFGTGAQARDFTYVDDVVSANLAALEADLAPGTVANIAGGSSASLNEVIELVSTLVGKDILLQNVAEQPGDVHRTGGATDLARNLLKWEPSVGLREGLGRQVEWHLSQNDSHGSD